MSNKNLIVPKQNNRVGSPTGKAINLFLLLAIW